MLDLQPLSSSCQLKFTELHPALQQLLQQTLGRVSKRVAGGVFPVHGLRLEFSHQCSYCCSYMQSESSIEAKACNGRRLVFQNSEILHPEKINVIKQCKERAASYISTCHCNLCRKSFKVFHEVSWEPPQTGRELRPCCVCIT